MSNFELKKKLVPLKGHNAMLCGLRGIDASPRAEAEFYPQLLEWAGRITDPITLGFVVVYALHRYYLRMVETGEKVLTINPHPYIDAMLTDTEVAQLVKSYVDMYFPVPVSREQVA